MSAPRDRGRSRPDIMKAQRDAITFTREYISTKPLGLPELGEADFEKVMNAVTRAMIEAYAAGFMAGAGR